LFSEDKPARCDRNEVAACAELLGNVEGMRMEFPEFELPLCLSVEIARHGCQEGEGDPQSCHVLATSLEKGTCGEHDEVRAAALRQIACDHGYRRSCEQR